MNDLLFAYNHTKQDSTLSLQNSLKKIQIEQCKNVFIECNGTLDPRSEFLGTQHNIYIMLLIR